MAYKHGIYPSTEGTETNGSAISEMATVVIGTAPVHYLDDPTTAVNKPILCRGMADCKAKVGYSENFEKFTACQSMYTNHIAHNVAPVVYINVLDPAKHKTTVEAASKTVSDNTIVIDDDVIVSSLVVKKASTALTKGTDYITEWVNGKLIIYFTAEQTGEMTVNYDRIDVSKVSEDDIIGGYEQSTEKRTGAEVIRDVFTRCAVVPFLIIAPGWSKNDTVGAVLDGKTKEINGCFSAHAILDLDTSTAKTRAAAITAKKSRTATENSHIAFPMIKKNGKIIAMSAWIAAELMTKAAVTGGVYCSSPSNTKINIDDCVLEDGTSVYYDTEDGNELNAAGIVTVISRNGWYIWGNSTAAYPDETDPVKRFIMTRLTFNYIENDFIVSNFERVDQPISRKIIEDLMTDENIKLAGYKADGYILGASMTYDPADNDANTIMSGKLVCRTKLAANIPAETIENIFSFDKEMLESVLTGGAE